MIPEYLQGGKSLTRRRSAAFVDMNLLSSYSTDERFQEENSFAKGENFDCARQGHARVEPHFTTAIFVDQFFVHFCS